MWCVISRGGLRPACTRLPAGFRALWAGRGIFLRFVPFALIGARGESIAEAGDLVALAIYCFRFTARLARQTEKEKKDTSRKPALVLVPATRSDARPTRAAWKHAPEEPPTVPSVVLTSALTTRRLSSCQSGSPGARDCTCRGLASRPQRRRAPRVR